MPRGCMCDTGERCGYHPKAAPHPSPPPFYESVLCCPAPTCRWRIKAADPERYALYAEHYRVQHNDGGDDRG